MRWRLLRTLAAPGAWQMALDEALLLGVGDDARPTLRFYRFDPPALSLGWFQRVEGVPGAREGGAVRRLTGGGAIHHANELTFAFAASAEEPLYRGPVADSYARVHGAIARALASLGLRALPRGAARLSSDAAGTGMCFRESASVDLVWSGPSGAPAKGVGSAQRRSHGRVLHHGSIKLAPDAREIGAATVGVDFDGLAAALLAAFRAELGVDALAEEEPKDSELAHALARAPLFAAPERFGGRGSRAGWLPRQDSNLE